MRKPSFKVPKYSHHKARNLARVTIDGKDIYLGKYNSPESHQEYDRLIAEWLLHQQVTPIDGDELTVCELMAAYLNHARSYYVKNKEVTSEFGCISAALKPVRRLYPNVAVSEFGPKALKAVRQKMIDDGCTRKSINSQISRVVRMFKYGVSEELVPASVYQALATVGGLRKGRTEARERPSVPPVADEIVDQTLKHLPSPIVAAMVRLQRFSGARPGEVSSLRPIDVDRSGDVWTYKPYAHKNEHHERQRVIFFGPQAQAILLPFLDRPENDYCFSPKESEIHRLKQRHAKRTTPLAYGNRPKRPSAKRLSRFRDHYTSESYRQAIHRCCEKHGIKQWCPNQLRHAAASEI